MSAPNKRYKTTHDASRLARLSSPNGLVVRTSSSSSDSICVCEPPQYENGEVSGSVEKMTLLVEDTNAKLVKVQHELQALVIKSARLEAFLANNEACAPANGIRPIPSDTGERRCVWPERFPSTVEGFWELWRDADYLTYLLNFYNVKDYEIWANEVTTQDLRPLESRRHSFTDHQSLSLEETATYCPLIALHYLARKIGLKRGKQGLKTEEAMWSPEETPKYTRDESRIAEKRKRKQSLAG